ncbi:MAG: hypothetical protein AAGB05_18315 [Pseudomonadota bacterium]
MTSFLLHPSELAYGLANARSAHVIGWGDARFLPAGATDADLDAWVDQGAERLLAAGGLTGTSDEGLNFAAPVAEIIMTLADPTLVLLVERKVGDGMRRMTVHFANNTAFGMIRRADGMFEIVRYAELTAAAVACAAYLGMALSPVEAGTHLTSTFEGMKDIRTLAKADQIEAASSKLTEIGATTEEAASILEAMTAPRSSGGFSILYCAGNKALNAQSFSVMSNAEGETWSLFPQGSVNGPMILERSSVQALAGRVIVTIAAQLELAKAG